MANENEGRISRIAYVEPNDVYTFKKKNGELVPLTIPYEDLCIAFNLIVDVHPRLKSNISSGTASTVTKDGIKQFQLSWVSTDKFPVPQVRDSFSFLQGDDFGKENGPTYLTTYYTEIDFENYGTKKIVEGLGVESIQVNFESWYTPTVTIKFVDVRGSAIWGNEEAIHSNGKLTSDNIFGCFFSIPYPQFRLQIKGFLGKPVTYQLTCSSFKGEYNAQTGNFEAIAQFIGYSYSLLTDIPMEYLIAAPFCPYVGSEYWRKHVNSSEWALDDGSAPPTLAKFFYMIERAQKDGDVSSQGLTTVDNEELSSISNEKANLRDISDKLNLFIANFKKMSDSYYDETDADGNRQIFCFIEKGDEVVDDSSIELEKKATADVITSSANLCNAVKRYNNSFVSRKISTDMLPNGWADQTPNEFTFIRGFNVTKDSTTSKITKIDIYNLVGDRTETNIKKIKYNDGKIVNSAIAKRIFDGTTPTEYSDTIKRFVYILDLSNLSGLIRERSEELNKREKDIVRRVNSKVESEILSVIGFKPYIGNVFKIVMCHLETFIHIMMEAANDIYAQVPNGERSPSKLNVNMDKTDVVSTSGPFYLPPWPSVYNHGAVSSDGGKIDEGLDVFAWVGDFSHNFIEEQVILGLQAAVQRIKDNDEYNNNKNKTQSYIPLTPFDINLNNSPYSGIYDNVDVSSLAGYIGIRSAQILGILNNRDTDSKMISLLAKLDACNYYSAIGSFSVIQSEIFDGIGQGNMTDTLLGISKCDMDYDKFGVYYDTSDKSVHTFETVNKIYYNDKRHPIISDYSSSDEYYVFSYYYNNNRINVVPSRLNDYKYYKESFDYVSDANYQLTYFNPLFKGDDAVVQSRDWIYSCDSTKLISEDDYTLYTNKDMFNVISDDNVVKGIIGQYDYLKEKNGGIEIKEYIFRDDITTYLSKYWKVDNEYYSKFFGKDMMSSKADKLGIKNLFPDKYYGEFDDKYILDRTWIDANKSNTVSIDKGIWKEGENDSNLDNLCFQQFLVNHNETAVGHLFGCPFYYMQNNKNSAELKDDNITDGEIQDRKRKVKALLFLHTFKYNYNDYLNVFNPNKANGAMEVVPYGYLLLLGGLLWRHRYIKKNGIDPIIYEEGEYKYKSAYNTTSTKEYTLFIKDSENYRFTTIKDKFSTYYNVPVSELFGGIVNGEYCDINIENQLVEFFEEFCDKDFADIMSKYEITHLYHNIAKKTDDSREYTYERLLLTIKEFYGSKDSKGIYKYDINNINIAWLRNNIGNWFGHYKMITVNDNSNPEILCMLMNENEETQNLFKKLYTQKVILIDANHRRMWRSKDEVQDIDKVIMKKNLHRTYVNSFITQLKEIIDNANSLAANPDVPLEVSEKLKINRDIAVPMYYYLKNLWDKWLIPASENEFDVSTFFKKNFFFIDSYYRNTYNLLPLNCQKILEAYTGMAESASLFTFLNDIISEHRCIFFALPDYIGFDGQSQEADINLMKEMFKPMPYNKMPAPELHNKFVIIFTSKPSEVSNENNGFKYDGFDIWSNSKEDVAPEIFKTDDPKYNQYDEVNTKAYNVPSFGVAINRQHNHIFKDIKLNMNNPVMTEQSILALNNVINIGKSGERKIAFHGQDVYNIFSSYSYICEVEMIGNAQICPLMYFQLLNIPMWRGTYMIFNVTHTMTPGDMTTRFKGMKMSKTPIPFATSFFHETSEFRTIDDLEQNNYSRSYSGDNVQLESSYEKSVNPKDYWYMQENRVVVGPGDSANGYTVDPDLVSLYNKLYDEINMLSENNPTKQWNVCISHVLRSGSGNSDHYKGNAVDLKIMRFQKDGSIKYCKAGKDEQKELLKVIDILYSNHKNEFSQAILEYQDSSHMKEGTKYNFHVLHISSNRGRNYNGQHEILIASQDKNYGSINKNVKSKDWFLNNVPEEFKKVAAKVYYNDSSYFKGFNNYKSFGNYTDSELRQHFGENVYAQQFNGRGYTKAGGNVATRLNNPGNIRKTNIEWEGQILPGDSTSFCHFRDMYYGTRALFLNMNTQITKYNKNTVKDLISVWAPAIENDTNSYIDNVCKGAGVKPNTSLTSITSDKNLYKEIAKQIAIVEDHIVLTDDCVDKAYDMACSYILKKA